MNFSLEAFLHGRFARSMRYLLAGAITYGVANDYYVMHYYEAFDPSETSEWVVDYSAISRPKAQLYVFPNMLYANYSPWTPVNGDVIRARVAPEHPGWVQMLNGRFLERSSCGVQLVIPLAEYNDVLAERQKAAAAIPMGQTALEKEFNDAVARNLADRRTQREEGLGSWLRFAIGNENNRLGK